MAQDSEICPTCGQGRNENRDMEQYLNTARDYLNQGTTKASAYAMENPGKVAAGVAALALGAGLLISTLNRE